MTKCTRNNAYYFDICLAQKRSLRLKLTFQTESSVPNDKPVVICEETFKTSITHIVLLEHFKAIYTIKMFGAGGGCLFVFYM